MSLLKCSFCGQKFYGSKCPTCGRDGVPIPEPKTNVVGCLALVVLAGALGIYFMFGTSSTPSTGAKTPLQLKQSQRDALDKAIEQGFLVLEPNNYRAFVDPMLWRTMDAKLKEDFTATVALRCAEMRGDDSHSVDLVDKQSAKKLASWGLFGFKAEQ